MVMNSTGRSVFQAVKPPSEKDPFARDSNGAPTDPHLRAAYHLLSVWIECGEQFLDDKDVLHLEHFCSGAREKAAPYLEDLGLGVNQGWSFTPNSAGLALVFPGGFSCGGRYAVGWEKAYQSIDEMRGPSPNAK